ncbi:MAG: ATP-binding protein, partial [Acetobacteraceae bacterium]|nr:ATP-binding protein [Acetobacteraceae bacterium]
MVLLAIAAIPLVAMAALVAWQNYEITVGGAQQAVLLIREAAIARHEAALESVRQILAAVARAEVVGTGAAERCGPFLSDVLALNRDRLGNLAALYAEGRLRCSAEPIPGALANSKLSEEAWFESVRREEKPAIGRAPASLTSTPGQFTIVATPIMDGSRFQGVLTATVRMDWLAKQSQLPDRPADRASIWLANTEGPLLPVSASSEAELPPRHVLKSLLTGSPGTLESRSEDGRHFAYAVALLSDGVRLLAGYDASLDIAQGKRALIARSLELVLLLLLGMIAVAAGVHVAVVEPLKRLTAAVGRWRGGGPFTPGSLAGVPSEVGELSNAFSQATGALSEREGQLRSALSHQDVLMHEIHHRVKNNLQVVASLLNLQASRIRLPEAKAEFESARDRVRALATLHRHLYLQGELETINMRSFLSELCGQLFQPFGEGRGGRIQLEIEAPELRMSSDQAVPLALIVTEAVSNAVKYAFPGGRPGQISVRMTADAGRASLVIQDDGVGIQASRAQPESGTRDGIGIQLIRGSARQ